MRSYAIRIDPLRSYHREYEDKKQPKKLECCICRRFSRRRRVVDGKAVFICECCQEAVEAKP